MNTKFGNGKGLWNKSKQNVLFMWNLWKIIFKKFAIWFVQDCANDWTSCVKSYIVLGHGNFVVELLMKVELFYL